MKNIYIIVAISAIFLSGCSENKEDNSVKIDTTVSSKTIVTQKQEAVSPKQNIHSESLVNNVEAQHTGTVVESKNVVGYTYVKVNENGNMYWVAGPETTLVNGEKISFKEQMVLKNFKSKALNRSFDSLIFATALVSGNIKKNDFDSCASSTKQVTAQTEQKISVAKISDGYTVEELYSKKESLRNKTVKVNAKVVKVSKNIMKKDWIHIQDGTGGKSTNDLVVTATNSTVSVGDIVTIEAVANIDVDFGYGYFFPLILQEAKFTALK